MPTPLRSRARLTGVAFGLNIAWEVAHWPLFECPWSPLLLVRAAAIDAAVTVAAAEMTSLASGRSDSDATLLTALGGAALAIELAALKRGRRLYGSAMPTVAGVALTPLAQLPLLGAVAVRLARRPGQTLACPTAQAC